MDPSVQRSKEIARQKREDDLMLKIVKELAKCMRQAAQNQWGPETLVEIKVKKGPMEETL